MLHGVALVPFLVLTVLLGGGAGWLTGRAVALTWRPLIQLLLYALLIALAVRFLHYALGEGLLVSPSYGIDLAFVLIGAGLGFRLTRARQMVRQYGWLYERAGPLSWRLRPAGPADGSLGSGI